MKPWQIAALVGFLPVFAGLGCGASPAQLEQVWNDLQAMQLTALPRLADYDNGPWEPSAQCKGGRAVLRHDAQVRREGPPGAVQMAAQNGTHDIELHGCIPSKLVYSGSLQRELLLKRTQVAADARTVDWLHGTLQLTGAWEEACQVNLRGTQRGQSITYQGRLCDEQVQHSVPVP